MDQQSGETPRLRALVPRRAFLAGMTSAACAAPAISAVSAETANQPATPAKEVRLERLRACLQIDNMA
ncbi:MAG: hypothetical protein ACYC35_17795 [Pirellulales bacterium]